MCFLGVSCILRDDFSLQNQQSPEMLRSSHRCEGLPDLLHAAVPDDGDVPACTKLLNHAPSTMNDEQKCTTTMFATAE